MQYAVAHSLLDDWRDRRAWLASGSAQTEQLAEVQIRILDYLADEHPWVRLQATFVLGRIGTLEDISLLSDLLALPQSADEHSRERTALAWAMRKIAEVGQ